MTQNDCDVKNSDVENENVFFGDFFIAIEKKRDNNNKSKKTNEFCEVIIPVFAVEITVVKAPKDSWSKCNFNMFPSRFVNSSEKTDDMIFAGPVIKEMGNSADSRDGNYAEPKIKSRVHGFIIT